MERLSSVRQDLEVARRVLVKDRWVTLLAVLVLGLGLGANNTVFTAVNAVLFKGLPFEDTERIAYLGSRNLTKGQSQLGVSYPDYLDWREASTTFSDLGAFFTGTMNVSDADHPPERIAGAWVTANAFSLLGQKLLLGRDFAPDEDRPGAAPVVILGYGVWKNRYGGDAGILGRAIRVNEVPATIIGVMPEGMRFPYANEMWQPLDGGSDLDRRDRRTVSVFGRLAPGIRLEEAQTEMSGMAARLQEQYPETNEGVDAFVISYNEQFNGGRIKLLFLVMLCAVGFVLLIACANVANLLLARALHRAREMAMRTALGASRVRLVRQLLVESLLLSSLGGLLGLALSIAGVRLFARAVANVGKPYWIDFGMDWRVFSFFFAISVLTGILFGLAPALQGSGVDVNRALQEGGRSGGAGRRTRRLTRAMVVVQLALTIVLTFAAGLMIRSFVTVNRFDVGIETKGLLTMQLLLSERKYPGAPERIAFHRELAEALAAAPGIGPAAVASHAPMGGSNRKDLTIEGRAAPSDGRLPEVGVVVTSPSYFETLGVALLRGRPFRETDGTEGSAVAIVNQRFATVLLNGENPVGVRIRVGETGKETPWLTIVGMAPDVRQRSFRSEQAEPTVYVPYRQEPVPFVHILARGRVAPEAMSGAIRAAVREIDPDLPVFSIRTLEEALAALVWPFVVFYSLFVIFALIALTIAAVGIYGVMAYAVSQRAQEIGMRIVLGAERRDIRSLILRQALVEIVLGTTIGVAGALFTATVLSTLLVRVTPRDPATLVAVSVLLRAVSATACLGPARRAARLDPLDAVRGP